MPFFALQLTGNGPLVDAYVGVSSAKKTALVAGNQTIPLNQTIRALLDTGASCTCIDPTVLNALGLTATGSTLVNTPSTGAQPQSISTFDVSLTIPCSNQASLIVETLEVIESQLLVTQGFHALIGRDILANCHMTYDGKHKIFTLAY
jgi:hypothetical protein